MEPQEALNYFYEHPNDPPESYPQEVIDTLNKLIKEAKASKSCYDFDVDLYPNPDTPIPYKRYFTYLNGSD